MKNFKLSIFVACFVCFAGALAAQDASPDSSDQGCDTSCQKRKLAETIQRKSALVKQAAEKKYDEARKLRQQAGIVRGGASAKSREILSRAEFNQGTAEFFGDVFGLLSNVASMNPMSTSAASFNRAQPTMSFLVNYQQKAANKESAQAQNEAGQIDGLADKQAMPMEMRAQALEEEGNRLMDAYNKIDAIGNAYFLLAVAADLKVKIKVDKEFIDGLKGKNQI